MFASDLFRLIPATVADDPLLRWAASWGIFRDWGRVEWRVRIISERCTGWSYHGDHIRAVSRLCGVVRRPDVCCLVFVQHLHSITLVYMFVFILLLAHPVRHSLDLEENNNNPEYLESRSLCHKLYAIGFHLIFFFLYIFLKTLTNNCKIPQDEGGITHGQACVLCWYGN